MEEFNRFIDSNLHQILGLMIDNANKLLDEAHNAGIVTDASLEQIRTRFENPGPDHRNWFKARFWQVQVDIDARQERANFSRLAWHLSGDTITRRLGVCLNNSQRAFDNYHNTLAHVHRVRPYSIMAIASTLIEITNELKFTTPEQTTLFTNINKQLKNLLLNNRTFLHRIFDTDEEAPRQEETQPNQIVMEIRQLLSETVLDQERTINELQNKLEAAQNEKDVLNHVVDELETEKTALSESLEALNNAENAPGQTEKTEENYSDLQNAIINEIEFDAEVLEQLLFERLADQDISLDDDDDSWHRALSAVLTTLNDKSSTGKYLQDALTNFQEGHFLGVSDNLNRFITSLWGTIYSNIQDINFNQEEDESDAEEQETQITTTGNLSWDEVKIELDELRKEIKSRARLENWENPLMKAVIDRVGVKEIDSLEKWKNDEIIQDIYNRYIPQVTLDQYYEVLNTYWQEIRDILENWRRT